MQEKIFASKFTKDSWDKCLDSISREGEVVGDIVVETMANLWHRRIVVYSRAYPHGISEESFNEEASKNGPPLLLAREKLFYQSLKQGEITGKSKYIVIKK